MSPTSTTRPDFVPTSSIIAFVFIGVVALVGLIARCLALNHSTIHGSQSFDLMMYRPFPMPKPKHPTNEPKFDSNSESRDQQTSVDDPVTPARIQRGPKNL
jgi:hypothetical protein